MPDLGRLGLSGALGHALCRFLTYKGLQMKRRIARTTPCRKMVISAQGKTFTLALPWSIGRTFTIGPVTFEHNGNAWRPDRPIPESWFIDLAKGGEA